MLIAFVSSLFVLHSDRLASYHSRKLRMGCQYPSCTCARTSTPARIAIGRISFPKSSRSEQSSMTPSRLSMALLLKMYTPMFTCTSQSVSAVPSGVGPTATVSSSSRDGRSWNAKTSPRARVPASVGATPQTPKLVTSRSPMRRDTVAIVIPAPVSLCVRNISA